MKSMWQIVIWQSGTAERLQGFCLIKPKIADESDFIHLAKT